MSVRRVYFQFRRASSNGRPETPHPISLIIPVCLPGLDPLILLVG
jgi:hypothetical protein